MHTRVRHACARITDVLLGPLEHGEDDDGAPPLAVELPAGGRLLLGRSSACDVRLPQASVSRRHAELRCEDGGGWLLVDWASTNGTWVNGVRVERAPVAGGDELRLGDARIVLRRQ